jgi:hypothetical protein
VSVIEVRTQDELEKALRSLRDDDSVSCVGAGSFIVYESAPVRAHDSASVTAFGSASVTASGSASVTAYDSASVERRERA